MRLRYSKLLNDIGTRVNFFSLRYSTAGFYTLSDTTYKGMAGGAPKQTVEDDGTVTTHYDTVYNLHMSRKAKNQLLLSQPMGEYGALSLSWGSTNLLEYVKNHAKFAIRVERDVS